MVTKLIGQELQAELNRLKMEVALHQLNITLLVQGLGEFGLTTTNQDLANIARMIAEEQALLQDKQKLIAAMSAPPPERAVLFLGLKRSKIIYEIQIIQKYEFFVFSYCS